jgi:serine protease Do
VSSRPNDPFPGGYALIYSNDTVAGMSGGPVLDAAGRLIGIHGQAETERNPGNQSGSDPIRRTNYNYGIPSNTLMQVAARSGVDLADLGVRVDNTPTAVSQPVPLLPSSPTLPGRPGVIRPTTPSTGVCAGRRC